MDDCLVCRTLHTSHPYRITNIKCRIELFSWWWAHSRPKHVEKRNEHTKNNCARSWLYLQYYTGMHDQQNIKFYFFCKKHFSTVSVCRHSWYAHQIAWFCASDFRKICRCVMIKRLVIITQREGQAHLYFTMYKLRAPNYICTHLFINTAWWQLAVTPALNKRHASSESPPHVSGREGSWTQTAEGTPRN